MSEAGSATAIAVATSTATAIATAVAQAVSTIVASITISFAFVSGKTIEAVGNVAKEIGREVASRAGKIVSRAVRTFLANPEIGLTGFVLAVYLMS